MRGGIEGEGIGDNWGVFFLFISLFFCWIGITFSFNACETKSKKIQTCIYIYM